MTGTEIVDMNSTIFSWADVCAGTGMHTGACVEMLGSSSTTGLYLVFWRQGLATEAGDHQWIPLFLVFTWELGHQTQA